MFFSWFRVFFKVKNWFIEIFRVFIRCFLYENRFLNLKNIGPNFSIFSFSVHVWKLMISVISTRYYSIWKPYLDANYSNIFIWKPIIPIISTGYQSILRPYLDTNYSGNPNWILINSTTSLKCQLFCFLL